MALVGCQGVLPPAVDVDEPVRPLSKVYVENGTQVDYHVQMNWPDGFVQVSRVDANTTRALAGAIGTSGFPATIEVLTDECELVVSLAGLPAGSTGIVVISPSETTLHRLDVADFSWGIADSIPACEATPVD